MTALLLPSSSANVGAAATATAIAQKIATNDTLFIPAWSYTVLSVLLALAGVYLARLVTINDENKKLGRVQSFSETGPLTWIGVLIVCPLIWHYSVAVPWAAMIGLGVGYSVKIILRVLGSGAAGAARGMATRAAEALGGAPAVRGDAEERAQSDIIDRMPKDLPE